MLFIRPPESVLIGAAVPEAATGRRYTPAYIPVPQPKRVRLNIDDENREAQMFYNAKLPLDFEWIPR